MVYPPPYPTPPPVVGSLCLSISYRTVSWFAEIPRLISHRKPVVVFCAFFLLFWLQLKCHLCRLPKETGSFFSPIDRYNRLVLRLPFRGTSISFPVSEYHSLPACFNPLTDFLPRVLRFHSSISFESATCSRTSPEQFDTSMCCPSRTV